MWHFMRKADLDFGFAVPGEEDESCGAARTRDAVVSTSCPEDDVM
jgi:hypothetical protein